MITPVPQPVFRARLERLIDGDSGEIRLYRYFGDEKVVTYRLLGIDCPERYTTEGKAATAFATDWLANAASYDGRGFYTVQPFPLVAEVALIKEKYGRTLLNIWRSNDGTNLGDALFAAGHGTQMSVIAQMVDIEELTTKGDV